MTVRYFRIGFQAAHRFEHVVQEYNTDNSTWYRIGDCPSTDKDQVVASIARVCSIDENKIKYQREDWPWLHYWYEEDDMTKDQTKNNFLIMSGGNHEWISEAKDLNQVEEQVLEMVTNGVPESTITVYKVSEILSVKVQERITLSPRMEKVTLSPRKDKVKTRKK